MNALFIDEEFSHMMPPLAEDELDELEQSIFKHGCRDPLVVWQGQNILLDGHNRYRICTLNDIPFQVTQIELESRDNAKIWIIRNQLARRNLSKYDRSILALQYKDIIAAQARTNQGHRSDLLEKSPVSINTRMEVAEIAGVSDNTIARVERIEEKATSEQKMRLRNGEASINEVFKEIRKAEKAEKKEARKLELIEKAEQLEHDGLVEVIHGDFREVCKTIESESVDLILTDPPYPEEYLPLWSDLGREAENLLRPGAFCIAYSGQLHLPEVIRSMAEHLTCYWTFALYHEGPTQLVLARNVICEWKPILVFCKPPLKNVERTCADYVVSPARAKGLHEWQQHEVPVEYLIEHFSEPGDLVLDPFAGSGTVPAVCKKKKRRCIAIEIDEESADIARGRLAEIAAEPLGLDNAVRA